MYYIIIGTIIGTGILSIANSQVKECYQDGWISVILGGIYPIIVVLLSSYISKKNPNKNILILSEEFLGKLLGNIMNFIFLTFFLVIAVLVVSGFNNIMMIYATAFMSPIQLIGIVGLLGGYVVYKGIGVLAKINKFFFYANILLIVLILPALKRGSYLNILPVFQCRVIDLMKGAKETFYSYVGAEIMLLITPYISDKNKIRTKSIKAVLTTIFMYFLVVFITIHYYGPDIVTKSTWSLVNVSESIRVTLINNFRFIFASIWIVITLKIFSNYYYASTIISEHIFKNVKRQYICIILYIIILISAMKFTDENYRREFTGIIAPIYTSFILIFIIVIVLFSVFKVGVKHEKK